MAIKISKTMRNKLPAEVRENAEELLWSKSNGRCYLCEVQMNRAADDIEADHDIAEVEGGDTSIENLNLAHISCNRAKRNAKTIPIRPYLKLVAYAKKRRLRYDGFQEHFGVVPKPVVITRQDNIARIELPDGAIVETPVLNEHTASADFEYIFLQLPRNAIFNDDACQPRTLRLDHAWAIYSDLQRNPLHEPPSCRAETTSLGTPVRLLMFDGQHKTIANWMLGRDAVTTKVYLNLGVAKANELVNSIQAKIKKLPLSPFELAGKMSDEWENKFHEYEEAQGAASVSEKGFLDWLPSTERTRGKQALQAALVQNILSNEDLRIARFVTKAGSVKGTINITEQSLKAKLIEKLLILDPKNEIGEDAQASRDLEAANVIMCLNLLSDLAFDPQEEATELTVQEIERARRITYQSSLSYVATLIRHLWFHIVTRVENKSSMTDTLSEEQLAKVRLGVQRLVDHPAWTAPLNANDRMKRLKLALEKNQEVPAALEDLGLSLEYLIVGNQSTVYKNVWLTPVQP